MTMARRPRVGLLYQFFHPDDVVSARIFSELGSGLNERGWDVTAWPCNRSCHHASDRYPLVEKWDGVAIRRIWRPAFRQTSGLGRILNAAWTLAAWCVKLASDRSKRPDVLVLGTDPIFGILIAPVVRKLLPDVRLVHWCFDLYPEYAIADGMFRENSLVIRALKRLLPACYAAFDLVADLGICMRSRLATYGHNCRKVTLTPWALAEPAEVERPDPLTRRELFGDSPLGLLYSGNFARPHSYADILALARRLRNSGIHCAFGIRGSRSEELRQAVLADDTDVSFAGFAPEAELVKRLAAADIHVVSLRPEYTGLAVPSKFFGALAIGRPVVFSGTDDCAQAQWIEEFKVGWVLNERTQERVAAELLELRDQPGKLGALQEHCFRVYREHFSRESVLDGWDRELRAVVLTRPGRTVAELAVSGPGW